MTRNEIARMRAMQDPVAVANWASYCPAVREAVCECIAEAALSPIPDRMDNEQMMEWLSAHFDSTRGRAELAQDLMADWRESSEDIEARTANATALSPATMGRCTLPSSRPALTESPSSGWKWPRWRWLARSAFGRQGRRWRPANAQDRFACGDLPFCEPLNATLDDERPFVLKVQPRQFEQVGIDPIVHEVIVERRQGLFDDRNWRKRPDLDTRRASYCVAQMCDGGNRRSHEGE